MVYKAKNGLGCCITVTENNLSHQGRDLVHSDELGLGRHHARTKLLECKAVVAPSRHCFLSGQEAGPSQGYRVADCV